MDLKDNPISAFRLDAEGEGGGNPDGLDDRSFRLASRSTGLAFQRTRLSADRTLMAVIRTSFALISFGFTIYQFFRSLHESDNTSAIPAAAARNFGMALVSLGVFMLVLGIVYHIRFMSELRRERHEMIAEHLLRGEMSYPVSLTMIVAALLLLIGMIAIIGMLIKIGPFQ